MDQILQDLSDEYHDLNGSHIEMLDQPPTPLQFSRIAHISRPVVIRGHQIPALSLWSDEYLVDKLGDRPLRVAVTPNGRADSICRMLDGTECFAEPHTEEMSISALLAAIKASDEGEVCYLQSQNGNMYSPTFFADEEGEDTCEFLPLRPDVPSQVPWCSEALDRPPDAVNIWIGDSRSVTSIHSDPYENIYTVVRGAKHFTLLPPTESWSLGEQEYPHATWVRSLSGDLEIQTSQDVPHLRWSSVIDPDAPGALPPGTHPIHITLHAGETLYLPAGWWHHVRQGDTPGRPTIAINWWYDVEMRGMSWVWLSFLRKRLGKMSIMEDEDIESTT